MKRLMFVLGLSFVVTLGSGRAESSIAPTVTAKAVAPTLDRARLTAWISEAKARSPRTFDALARVRARVPELDAKKRGPIAPLASSLSNLGPDSFAALAERIVDEDKGLTGSARRAWRVGLVEAIGTLRDPRVREVVAPLLDDEDDLVVRVAAAAIGKVSDDASAALLISHLSREAVVAGAGTCRRRGMANALAAVVSRRASLSSVKAAVHALGDLGAAWAWNTKTLVAPGEEGDIRSIAAAALVDAYVGFDGEIRQAASNALMVVDEPGTPARIASARSGASSDTLAALDRLAVRFARNPAR